MPVTVILKATGQRFRGKFAVIEADRITLYPDVTTDGRDEMRGFGPEHIFVPEEVEVLAHRWDAEILRR